MRKVNRNREQTVEVYQRERSPKLKEKWLKVTKGVNKVQTNSGKWIQVGGEVHKMTRKLNDRLCKNVNESELSWPQRWTVKASIKSTIIDTSEHRRMERTTN